MNINIRMDVQLDLQGLFVCSGVSGADVALVFMHDGAGMAHYECAEAARSLA